MLITFASYGHTRAPAHQGSPRNSIHLTLWGSLQGTLQAAQEDLDADVEDISPILNPGVNWDDTGRMHEEITEPPNVLIYQASTNPNVIRRARELNPDCLVIIQRDSTHAAEHLALMKAAMVHHKIKYQHAYERGMLDREVGEYEMADKVFVLSRWVKGTFDKQGSDKAVQFASQLAEVPIWDNPADKPDAPFRVAFAGQLGLRKGILEALEGWRIFRERTAAKIPAVFSVAGVIEAGAVDPLRKAIDRAFKVTPDVERLNWVNQEGMRKLYAVSHALLLPSVEEGSSMTGPEAALAGCALVATKNAGFDILENGHSGYEVPAMNPEAIADALTALATNRGHCHLLGVEARRRALLCGMDAYSSGFARTLTRVVREHGL